MASLQYTSITKFKEALPERRIGELSNDTDGSFTSNSDVVENALQYAEDQFESRVSVRDDYELPVLDDQGNAPPVVLDVIHDIATWKLYKRRNIMPEDVRDAFDVAMAWLDRVASRKANINVDQDGDGEMEDKTTETPIIPSDSEPNFEGNKFDNFQF